MSRYQSQPLDAAVLMPKCPRSTRRSLLCLEDTTHHLFLAVLVGPQMVTGATVACCPEHTGFEMPEGAFAFSHEIGPGCGEFGAVAWWDDESGESGCLVRAQAPKTDILDIATGGEERS